jgi:hypothetical protein
MAHDLGAFREGFAVWRRALDVAPGADRAGIFSNAANEVAGYVAKGLNRTVAADELAEIAEAYGLDTDASQAAIGEAFARAPRTENGHAPQRDRPGVAILSKGRFMETFKPPDYLIDGILQRGYLYALTGPTGHAKSAIALVIAELIGSTNRNAMFGKHKVDKGRVLYFVGENPIDLCMRVIGADSKRYDAPEDDQIYWITGVIDFEAAFEQIANGVRGLGGIVLAIVDTSAAYFLGEDENSNPQMGAHARKLRRLTTLPGNPCVIALCHPTKKQNEQDQMLPRGGGAFVAEIDGNLTCLKKDNELVELHHTKIRGPGFEPMMFKLETIVTPKLHDTKNRLLPTVRAVVVGEVEEDSEQSRLRNDEDRVLVQIMSYPGQSLAATATALGWVNGNGEALKKRVHRVIARLEDPKRGPKLLKRTRDGYETTDEGKKAGAKAASRFLAEADSDAQTAFELTPQTN